MRGDVMRLSACLIMRDAARDLVQCLESLKDGVDEMVIVDTGSEDDSVEIARRYTDKVYFFEWRDDFAAARNYCLERATGDWIVFLDSDEYLTPGTQGNLHRVVENLAAKGDDMADVFRENVDEDGVPTGRVGDISTRLFRNDPRLRYRDPIHEELVYDGDRRMRIATIPKDVLCIFHKGYSPLREREKIQRDLRMLEKMEREGQDKGLLHFYLGGMYFLEKDYEKALHYTRKAIERKETPTSNAFGTWRIWFSALQKLGRSLEEQEEVLRRGLEVYPKMADFHANYGGILMARGDFAGAWKRFRKAEKFMAEFDVNYPREANFLYRNRVDFYRAASIACLHLGKRDEALRYANLEWEARAGEERRGYSDYLPPQALSVLEFGCGTGETAAAFRRIRPECRYIGIDEDRGALQLAKHNIPERMEGTPVAWAPKEKDAAPLDCILYQDASLWGMTGECLRRHSKCLSEKGQMVFVLENVSYFRRLARLLSATGGFRESTLTLGGLERIIEDGGMEIFRAEPVYDPKDAEERQRPETKALLAAFDAYGGNARGRQDPWACRYIICAGKKPPERRLLVQAILGEPLVSARVRVHEPHVFLGTVPGVLCLADTQGANLAPRQEFPRRVLVRQRQQFRDRASALQQIDIMRRAGCLVIYETDVLPRGWEKEEERAQNLDILGAHVVQVPTEALAEELRPYHPHVKVIPNELRELPPPRIYDGGAPLTVFFGALNRDAQDWQDILPMLNEAAERYGERLRFRVLSDKPFFGALKAGNKEFIGNDAYYDGRLVPYPVYARMLHEADIVLLPLCDTRENRMKSDLLFLEAAGHGGTVLASPTAYGGTVEDGRTGFLFHSPGEFREKLGRLVEDGELRRNMAQSAYAHVRENRLLCRHYEERLDFYQGMLDRKDELDGELERRLTGLV